MFLILRAVGLILPSDIRRVQPGFTVPRGELYAELLPSATWYCSVSHIYRAGQAESPQLWHSVDQIDDGAVRAKLIDRRHRRAHL